jgi:hypothetical protein
MFSGFKYGKRAMRRTFTNKLMAVTLVSVSCVAFDVFGQVNQPFREELLALSVVPDVRAPSYTRNYVDEITLYGADSLVASIALTNHTGQVISLGPDVRDWTDALSISFEKVDEHAAEKAESRRLTSQERRPITTLEPRQSVTERFFIAAPKSDRGKTGRYRLVVQIEDSSVGAGARKFRNLLRRQITVNFRQPSTKEELADHYLQLAYQARVSGQPAESRLWAEKVLELNPKSIAALSDIGMLLLREGNCAQGKPIMTEVMRLLSAGEDPGLNLRDDAARDEWRTSLQERVTAQCR